MLKLPKTGTSLRRTLTVAAMVAAATALTVTTASADTRCAYFTTSQPDWAPGTTWGSWPNGGYVGPNAVYIDFQTDGNLVLRNGRTGNAVWASGTWGTGVTRLDWSASASGIVLYKYDGSIECTIAGYNASGGWAQVQDDGNFVFYNSSGAAEWATSWGWGTSQFNYCGVTGH